MKKFNLFTITALVLLLSILAGCGDDDDASMTFVDKLESPGKEFTIDSKLNFKVTFVNPTSTEQAMTIRKGDEISGKITEASAAWNKNLTGVAAQMTSTNMMINGAIGSLEVPISLTYSKTGNEITSVTVTFSGSGIAEIAGGFMGATYYRKY